MEIKKVIILGGLGNGSVIAAAIDDAYRQGNKEWKMTGYLNDRMKSGDVIEGFPVLGALSDTKKFIEEGYYFINTIYRIDGQDLRINMFENLQIPDERLVTFIHPTAYVPRGVEIGSGCVIMPNVSISPGVKFGRCCLVMIAATIGHNNTIGDHCHFAAESCVGAYLKIGKGVHIGLNASVREELTLGDYSTLAMGAVLLSDMGEFEIWAGVPAKLLRKSKQEDK